MASKRELQLIRLACQQRWLSAEQGEDCLFLKQQLGDKLSIEQILRQRRYLSDAQIAALRRAAASDAGRSRGPDTTESVPVAPSRPVSEAPAKPAASRARSRVGDRGEAYTEIDLSLTDLVSPSAVDGASTISGAIVLSPAESDTGSESRAPSMSRGAASDQPEPFDPEVEDRPGRFGPYHVHYMIARGERSAVFRATHVGSSRDIALKILSPRGRAGAAFVSERSEALVAAAQLDDPRIIRVLDVGHIADRYYVAVEHSPGWSLDDKLATTGMSVAEALQIGVDVASALAAAEAAAVVHADVRPGHVIVEDSGRARLTGFGFYNVFDGCRGTPGYMAPEVAAGGEPTSASDPYGLGAVLFLLVVGRPVFPGSSLAERSRQARTLEPPDPRLYRPDLPNGVARAILRLLARAPEARFTSSQEAAEVLEAERVAAAVNARRAAMPVALRPLVERAVIGMLGLALVALVVPLALDLLGWTSIRDGRLARPVAAVAAAALLAATGAHVVVALIRRGELPLPRSSAWLVRGQEFLGGIGATSLMAGFAVSPPAGLNLALTLLGAALLASALFGLQLRRKVASTRRDRGAGRTLAVLGDRRLVRWRHWHVPALASVAVIAIVRSLALAYFAAS